MKSKFALTAVVVTVCAAPAVSAEFPKTGEAECDSYYVDNVLAKIDSEAGTGESLRKLESPAMLKEKAHSMTCLFAAFITGAWRGRHVTPTGVAFTPTKMATTYSRPSTTTRPI